MAYDHLHSSNQSLVNDYLTKHLYLYLILMTNPTVLFPPMFTNEEPEMNKAEEIRNLLKATQTQVVSGQAMFCFSALFCNSIENKQYAKIVQRGLS